MFTTFSKNTIVPLLLRITLAAIFVFHGFHLVGDPGNEWGAAWLKLPKTASPGEPAAPLPQPDAPVCLLKNPLFPNPATLYLRKG